MNPHEFEQYVAKLIKELDSFKNGKIYTNHRFPGVRQPGAYEVDVAVEIIFEEIVKFLLIVECKNWKRPVDRPIVQKLVQTRDAIAAQKAAIASPVGFSGEAIEVAEANGVALWVVAENRVNVSMARPRTIDLHFLLVYLYISLRQELYELLGYKIKHTNKGEETIVEFNHAELEFTSSELKENDSLAYINGLERHDIDERTALYHIYNEVAEVTIKMLEYEKSSLGEEIRTWQSNKAKWLSMELRPLFSKFDIEDYYYVSQWLVKAIILGDQNMFLELCENYPLSKISFSAWKTIIENLEKRRSIGI